MACKHSPAQAFRLLSAASLVLCALAGCNRTPEIKSYPAPKESDAPAVGEQQPSVGETDPTDRMLAVLVPNGGKAWFFKLVGPQKGVGKYAAEFRSFVQSVKFADNGKAEPGWTLPAGWEQKPGNSEMRFATIALPSESEGLEVSVVPLPWLPQAYVGMLLTNVNRWRKQMQLTPVRADVLADEFETLKLPAGEAMLVDLKGKLKPDAMQPPFAAATGSKSLPAGHPPLRPIENEEPAAVDKQAGDEKPVAASNAAKPETSAANSSDANLPFTYNVPAEWTSRPTPTFAVAAFATKDDSAPVDVSITPMPPAGGDLLMNINRWRTMQLGLPPIKAEDLPSSTKPLEVGGKPAQLVVLASAEDANPRQAITAALVKVGNTTWVFRMKGGAEAVAHQQATFEKFLSSIKFRGAEK